METIHTSPHHFTMLTRTPRRYTTIDRREGKLRCGPAPRTYHNRKQGDLVFCPCWVPYTAYPGINTMSATLSVRRRTKLTYNQHFRRVRDPSRRSPVSRPTRICFEAASARRRKAPGECCVGLFRIHFIVVAHPVRSFDYIFQDVTKCLQSISTGSYRASGNRNSI